MSAGWGKLSPQLDAASWEITVNLLLFSATVSVFWLNHTNVRPSVRANLPGISIAQLSYMRIAFFGAWMFGIFFASFVTSDANDFSQPTLCSASEDCLAAYDARGRREWATRCFPSEQLAIESRAHFLDHDGTPHAAYPTFGRVDSRLGSEANWMANSQTRWIAPTQVNASCDVPEHFVIVDYLFRERGTPISNQNSTSLASHDQSGQN